MNWYISNINNIEIKDNITFSIKSPKLSVFIDGYILPRISFFEEYKNEKPEALVQYLYSRFGNEFINYIKGSFVIVIKDDKKFQVYTDRHATVKCFYFQTKENFIITNSLNKLKENIELRFSKENAAIFTLFNHFIGDLTLFEEVYQLKPASMINISTDSFVISNYWKPESLFNKKDKGYSPNKFANDWNKIIRQYHDYLNPKKISLTLTGGNDSRMILAALLANNITPLNMTYGDPKSGDVIVAKKICDKLNLPFKNYFVENPTADWFHSIINKEVLPNGNSLVNIHRAHRIEAIKQLKKDNSKVEMLYTGLVGGEYIKRPSYNNVSMPRIYETWLTLKSNHQKKNYISKILQSKGLKTDLLNLENIISNLDRLIIPKGSLNSNQIKFIHLYSYYAVTHHTQDPSLFKSHIKYIVNPYMDIDFLEALSKSDKWYLNRKINHPLEKVWHSLLQTKITHILYQELSSVPFAKNGEYTGLEMLKTPLKYLFKRFWRRVLKRTTTYERNFAMGSWLYKFSKIHINQIQPEISDIFEDNYLKKLLENIKDRKSEEQWHLITAPINLDLNYTLFKKD